MNICVYGAASPEIDKSYFKAGEALGLEMAKRGHTLVFGGGANGMMGAAARGITAGGGRSIGIIPSFFNVDGALFEGSEQIFTDTMRERKKLLEEMSDAFIVTAGGIGTYDEFFEIFTLKSLKRHSKPIVVLNTNGYFDKLKELLEHGISESFIGKKAVNDCVLFTDDIHKALDVIEAK